MFFLVVLNRAWFYHRTNGALIFRGSVILVKTGRHLVSSLVLGGCSGASEFGAGTVAVYFKVFLRNGCFCTLGRCDHLSIAILLEFFGHSLIFDIDFVTHWLFFFFFGFLIILTIRTQTRHKIRIIQSSINISIISSNPILDVSLLKICSKIKTFEKNS